MATENLKQCTKCKQYKDKSLFHKTKKNSNKLRACCKQCHNEQYRKNYAKKPDTYKKYTSSRAYRPVLKRKANLKKFGLTIEIYEKMLFNQNNVCAICKNVCASGKRLAVDHCHKTSKVRELLCRRCNQSMGKFNDDPILIKNVLDYLIKWQSN
jgi:hypothetical protein